MDMRQSVVEEFFAAAKRVEGVLTSDIKRAAKRHAVDVLSWRAPGYDNYLYEARAAARHYNTSMMHLRCVAMQQLGSDPYIAGPLWSCRNSTGVYDFMRGLRE